MSWNRRNVIVPIEIVKTKYMVLPCNNKYDSYPNATFILKKKYAIADLSNTIGGKSFVEVSVIAWNWISDDGSKCVYPTYLPPKKQAIAIQDCMAKIGGQF